jgi:hypothetical protein
METTIIAIVERSANRRAITFFQGDMKIGMAIIAELK